MLTIHGHALTGPWFRGYGCIPAGVGVLARLKIAPSGTRLVSAMACKNLNAAAAKMAPTLDAGPGWIEAIAFLRTYSVEEASHIASQIGGGDGWQ